MNFFKNSYFQDVYSRINKDKIAQISFVIILMYFIVALFSGLGLLFPDIAKGDVNNAYMSPDSLHFLGTDFLGRDVLGKAIHGTRTAIKLGILVILVSLPIGIFFGAVAGYFGGLIDEILIWFATSLDSIPYILLLISLMMALGPGINNASLALGLTSWVGLFRLIRSEFIKLRESEYVTAAKAIGASHFRRIFRHILPNTLHIVITTSGLKFVSAIKSEVILTFLGLGVVPGEFSWGVMIDDAKMELIGRGFIWQLLTATVFMFILIVAVNLFNDALRTALDPKLKNR